jgi:hypothetical protein
MTSSFLIFYTSSPMLSSFSHTEPTYQMCGKQPKRNSLSSKWPLHALPSLTFCMTETDKFHIYFLVQEVIAGYLFMCSQRKKNLIDLSFVRRYDFFLVSQSVQQGTVSPTSYNVISDNLHLEPDKLQRLTYKLTHLYFNWSVCIQSIKLFYNLR